MTRPTLILVLALSFIVGASPVAAAMPAVSTPRQTIETFLRSSREGDFKIAAQCLDLRDLPRATRDEQGILLAKELNYVLDRHAFVSLDDLPDEPQPSGQGDHVVAAEIALRSDSVDIALSRVRLADETAWLISRATVAATPALYRAYGPPPFYFRIPEVLRRYEWLDIAAWQWIGMGLALLLSYLAASVLVAAAHRTAQIFTLRTKTPWDDALIGRLRRPTRLLLAIALYEGVEPVLALPGAAVHTSDRLARIAIIITIGWLLGCFLAVGTAWAGDRLIEDTANELKSRGLRTQLLLLRRVGIVLIAFFVAAAVLLQFELVRGVGISLLASAGILGVVLGFALQKSLAGIIAGIQVSLTQPFRLGDVVIVEGEFGTVEQINLTYVVVRVWDERRLIIPMQRILEQPFENWTKVRPELLGKVSLLCDYGTPVDSLRKEIRRICSLCADWNGKQCDVAVTDATESKLKLRVVVSADNAEALWRLRCELREKLIAFLAAHDMGRGVDFAPRDHPGPS